MVNKGSYSVIDPFCKKRRVIQLSDSEDEVEETDDEAVDAEAKRSRTFVPATDDEGNDQQDEEEPEY